MPSFGQNLDRVKQDAKNVILQEISALRGRFITVAPGQEMTYMVKEKQALDYLSATPQLDEHPFIEGEIGITAPTAYEVAQVIANKAAILHSLGPKIEHIRMKWAGQVDVAESVYDVNDALAAFHAELSQVVT